MPDYQSQSLKGLRAIIIGAGFAGLSAAIELARLGASVQLFESSPDLKHQGERLKRPLNERNNLAMTCCLPVCQW